jgi:ATP-dependent Clp protease ATP-binding subunit ClpC
MRKKLSESLKRAFRPEFINRVDAVVIFRSLNRDDIKRIVSLELDKVSERLKDHDLTLVAMPEALSLLAEQGYDSEFGARPLRRVIQMKVEDPLSDKLLSGEFVDGDNITIIVDEDGEIALAKSSESVPEPSL